MGLGPIVLDDEHRTRIEEALSSVEFGLKKGRELSACLDTIDDEVVRYDLLELLFRAQDVLNLDQPDWMRATYLVRERMLDE